MVAEVGEIIGLETIAASCGAAASARADAAATAAMIACTVTGMFREHMWRSRGKTQRISRGNTTTAAAAHAPEASATGMVIGGTIAILLVIVLT